MDIKKIKEELQKIGRPCSERDRDFVLKYLATSKKYLCIKAPDRDILLREILKETKDLPAKQIIQILDELFHSGVYDYINFAGKFLTKSKKCHEAVSLMQIKKWVSRTEGWAECDVICQSLFSEKEVLERWEKWEKSIRKFSSSKNIQIRRASLVLQVRPNGKSHNPKLRKLAIETIEKLKGEKSVLITKAISWLLRALQNQNKSEIKKYLLANKSTLPPSAYRETMRKIETGKK